jgi:hypothetical protein
MATAAEPEEATNEESPNATPAVFFSWTDKYGGRTPVYRLHVTSQEAFAAARREKRHDFVCVVDPERVATALQSGRRYLIVADPDVLGADACAATDEDPRQFVHVHFMNTRRECPDGDACALEHGAPPAIPTDGTTLYCDAISPTNGARGLHVVRTDAPYPHWHDEWASDACDGDVQVVYVHDLSGGFTDA